MKTYLILAVLALSLFLAGCPAKEPAPVDTPDKAATDNAGVDGANPKTPD